MYKTSVAPGSANIYSEEVDPKTGEALGNFPQAFSHMGLILAAKEIEDAMMRTE